MSTNQNVSHAPSNADVREAIHEIQRYFSDELAPMMVADSVELLVACPPAVTVTTIKGWIASQMGRPGQTATVGDYVFHALKKLQQMVEYELIEPEKMKGFLEAAREHVLAMCPDEERDLLKANLERLGEVQGSAVVAQVEILHRQPGTAGPAGSAGGAPVAGGGAGGTAATDVAQGLRRLTFMLDRLGQQVTTTPGAPAPDDLRTYALATAAVNARDASEFASFIERLRGMGVDPRMDQLFRTLGRGLPGWDLADLAAPRDPRAPAPPESPAARAMRRIVSMADDSSEGLERITHMIQVAVEQFNDGSLARAAKMFRLAEESMRDMKLDSEVVQSLQRRAQDGLSVERLREYAERPERHRLLKGVLDCFPAYRVAGLFDSLAVEPRREQRRVMLSLLEVHGVATRQAALERLEACFNGRIEDPFGYFQRNLIFLLRRIPPAEDDTRDLELDYCIELSAPHHPGLLVREALGGLSQIKHPKAEQALIARLDEIEAALERQGEGERPEELRGFLDRAASGLARQGSPTALRALFKHAFKRRPIFGDTLARLEELGTRDLSVDPELLDSLLKALKREVPIKVLGFVMAKNREAVSILNSFEALKLPAKKKESQPAISGDLELFGLPNLLQSLADSSATGTLTLRDRQEQVCATIELRTGSVQACRQGALAGETAFYQLFEMPIPGTFVFETDEAAAVGAARPPLFDVQSGLLEALRRYDEFQLARTLAPDDAALKPTGKKPTAMEGETDVAFLRELWGKAAAGMSPRKCEIELATDSYRVRRLFAHWLETGALEPASGGPPDRAPGAV